jgi:hypothetical protein
VQVKAPELNVQKTDLTSVAIGQIGIGPITVGELVINDVDFRMNAGVGFIRGMTVQVKIHIDFQWSVHVPLPWPFDDINVGSTANLGTYVFNLPSIGDVTIPGLSNIDINIPSLTAKNVTASPNALTNLQLNNAVAEQIAASDVVLPSAGFTIAGLTLNSLETDNVSVPAAGVRQATIGHVHGDPLNIGELSLNSVALGSATVPTVRSTSPFDVPADLQPRLLPGANGFDLGILKFTLIVTPSVVSHIPFLEINNSNATATTGRVVVHNVTLPFDVLNLTLSQIGINAIQIPTFTAS